MATATKTRAVGANVMTQIARVARALGKESRKSLNETEPAHKAYLKADDKQQQAMRHLWVAEYMSAYLNIRNDEADMLRQAPREGAKDAKTIKVDDVEYELDPRTHVQQQAYDRARKLFAFHISRDDSRLNAGGARSKVRIDRPMEAALVKLCGQMFEDGATKATLQFIADQARALAAKYTAKRAVAA